MIGKRKHPYRYCCIWSAAVGLAAAGSLFIQLAGPGQTSEWFCIISSVVAGSLSVWQRGLTVPQRFLMPLVSYLFFWLTSFVCILFLVATTTTWHVDLWSDLLGLLWIMLGVQPATISHGQLTLFLPVTLLPPVFIVAAISHLTLRAPAVQKLGCGLQHIEAKKDQEPHKEPDEAPHVVHTKSEETAHAEHA